LPRKRVRYKCLPQTIRETFDFDVTHKAMIFLHVFMSWILKVLKIDVSHHPQTSMNYQMIRTIYLIPV